MAVPVFDQMEVCSRLLRSTSARLGSKKRPATAFQQSEFSESREHSTFFIINIKRVGGEWRFLYGGRDANIFFDQF